MAIKMNVNIIDKIMDVYGKSFSKSVTNNIKYINNIGIENITIDEISFNIKLN
jgi:hypothetical protein